MGQDLVICPLPTVPESRGENQASRRKESLPKVFGLIRRGGRTYDSQFQTHCSSSFTRAVPNPSTLSSHTSARAFIYSPDHAPRLLKDLLQLMALQINIQLLVLLGETLPTRVSSPYMHALQPSMASPPQPTHPHTCTHSLPPGRKHGRTQGP